MSTTRLAPPAARVRLGHARFDATPPVGIYNRLWGAARQDRATGVHRPLAGDLLVIEPVEAVGPRLVRLELDLCGLLQRWVDGLAAAVAAETGVASGEVVVSFSHTHSAGWLFDPRTYDLPGGELIEPYVADLIERARAAARQAVETIEPLWLEHAVGRCSLAANRDYRDEARDRYVTGFNPDGPADDTVGVVRAARPDGAMRLTIVHYACHPTSLAWENSLTSPDYIGAMRDEVERATGAPCVFFLGACGELGPRDGFVGDTEVADRNGRQLGYAALSALASLAPVGTERRYVGPILSGATLGVWTDAPRDDLAAVSRLAGGRHAIDLPLRARPDAAALEREIATLLTEETAARDRGDAAAARDAGARVERARRWLGRLRVIPPGDEMPLRFWVWQLGTLVWIACAGEPYSVLQADLRDRFPEVGLLVSPACGDLHVAYLLPRDRYGRGLYQEEPSILAAGCLERLRDAATEAVAALLATGDRPQLSTKPV